MFALNDNECKQRELHLILISRLSLINFQDSGLCLIIIPTVSDDTTPTEIWKPQFIQRLVPLVSKME